MRMIQVSVSGKQQTNIVLKLTGKSKPLSKYSLAGLDLMPCLASWRYNTSQHTNISSVSFRNPKVQTKVEGDFLFVVLDVEVYMHTDRGTDGNTEFTGEATYNVLAYPAE